MVRVRVLKACTAFTFVDDHFRGRGHEQRRHCAVCGRLHGLHGRFNLHARGVASIVSARGSTVSSWYVVHTGPLHLARAVTVVGAAGTVAAARVVAAAWAFVVASGPEVTVEARAGAKSVRSQRCGSVFFTVGIASVGCLALKLFVASAFRNALIVHVNASDVVVGVNVGEDPGDVPGGSRAHGNTERVLHTSWGKLCRLTKVFRDLDGDVVWRVPCFQERWSFQVGWHRYESVVRPDWDVDVEAVLVLVAEPDKPSAVVVLRHAFKDWLDWEGRGRRLCWAGATG